MIVALAYVQPGVTVTELSSPLQTPFLSSPTTLALVGLSAGFIRGQDNIKLDATTLVAIPGVPQTATFSSSTITSITDAVSTAVYALSDITLTVIVSPHTSTATAPVLVGDTVITIASTTGYAGSGVIMIDNEQIGYTGLTGTTFTGCIRGLGGTAAVAHTQGAAVIEAKYTIRRSDTSTIPNHNTITLRYTYTPADYFQPTLFDNLGAIQARYGTALDTNNNIVSDLTYASQLAFENGAATLVCQPLFYNVSGVPTQPVAGASSATTGSWAALQTWQDTMTSLRDYEDINVVIPVIGQNRQNVTDSEMVTNVFSSIQDHLAFMNTQQQHIVSVLGEDSTLSPGTEANLATHAATLQARQGGNVNQQIAFLSPASFVRPTPSSTGATNIGGQYVAASVGGMLAGRRVSQPLTRQIINGYAGVGTTRTKTQKNADAQAGLLVVQQVGNAAQIRHSITLDQSSSATRELSVVRAKYRMTSSIRQTLENNVIGQVLADDNAPITVANQVSAVLELLKNDEDIVDYKGVQARTLELDPTTVEVRFSYKPAFPLNYVRVIFSIDLTTGDVTVQ